jgi:signal transduction histidine kinase
MAFAAVLPRLLVLAVVSLLLATCLAVFKRVDAPFAGFKTSPQLIVSADLPAGWSGAHAGLRSRDRLLTANGVTLRGPADLDAVVASVPQGTPITYRLQRGALQLGVEVTTQRLRPRHIMASFFPVLLAIAVCYLIVGALAYRIRPRHPAVLALLIYSCANAAALPLAADPVPVLGLQRALLLLDAVLIASLVHLALVLPEPPAWLKRRPGLAWLLYGPALGFGLTWMALAREAGAAVEPVQVAAFEHGLSIWAAGMALGYAAFLLRSLQASVRGATPLHRAQARVMFLSFWLAYSPISLVVLVPILFLPGAAYYDVWVRLAIFSTVLFPLGVAYAALRHQLFDVEIVLKRTALYALLTAILSGLYAGLVLGLRPVMESLLDGNGTMATNVTATLAVALLFSPLRDRLQAWIDRTFFRPHYDFQAAVGGFADRLHGEGGQALRQTLDRTLSPTYMALYVRTEDGALVCEGPGETAMRLEESHPASQLEVGGRARLLDGEAYDLPAASLALPLGVEPGRSLGLVVIGPPRTGLDYRSDDRQLLKTLGAQLALWLDGLRLQAKVEALDEGQQTRKNFFNMVAHELRTPLTAVFGYTEFLDEEIAGPLNERQHKFVSQIRAGVLRVQGLVDDLLDMARMDAGTFALGRAEVDLVAKVREVADSLLPLVKAAELTLVLDLPETLDAWIDGDRIGQVIANLLGNAIKFTPAGGFVRLSLRGTPSEIRVEVRDTGPGIAAGDQELLFKRFSQLGTPAARGGRGTGLGLSIAKALVEAHGGLIGVESTPGEGATFWFTLPLASNSPSRVSS